MYPDVVVCGGVTAGRRRRPVLPRVDAVVPTSLVMLLPAACQNAPSTTFAVMCACQRRRDDAGSGGGGANEVVATLMVAAGALWRACCEMTAACVQGPWAAAAGVGVFLRRGCAYGVGGDISRRHIKRRVDGVD